MLRDGLGVHVMSGMRDERGGISWLKEILAPPSNATLLLKTMHLPASNTPPQQMVRLRRLPSQRKAAYRLARPDDFATGVGGRGAGCMMP